MLPTSRVMSLSQQLLIPLAQTMECSGYRVTLLWVDKRSRFFSTLEYCGGQPFLSHPWFGPCGPCQPPEIQYRTTWWAIDRLVGKCLADLKAREGWEKSQQQAALPGGGCRSSTISTLCAISCFLHLLVHVPVAASHIQPPSSPDAIPSLPASSSHPN